MKLEEVNARYAELCKSIGDAQYKIRQHEKLLESLYAEVDKINELAGMLKQQAALEASKAAEAKKGFNNE